MENCYPRFLDDLTLHRHELLYKYADTAERRNMLDMVMEFYNVGEAAAKQLF